MKTSKKSPTPEQKLMEAIFGSNMEKKDEVIRKYKQVCSKESKK